MSRKSSNPMFVLCIENKDCDDLGKGKVYRVVPDPHAKEENCIRVVDDSGEDYLYPASFFVPVELPKKSNKLWGMWLIVVGSLSLVAVVWLLVRESQNIVLCVLLLGIGSGFLYEGIQVLRGRQTISTE